MAGLGLCSAAATTSILSGAAHAQGSASGAAARPSVPAPSQSAAWKPSTNAIVNNAAREAGGAIGIAGNSDTSQGPPLAKLQALVAYWRDGYDWRRCEALLNGFGQFRTTIDGLGIHFLHVRSKEPDAMALLMAHGWPGSVLEFRHVIGRLTDPVAHGGEAGDAFHLVIPSMPGFGFSDKPAEAGWGISRIADAWIELVDRLGYKTWGAQGGDWGSAVIEAIGRKAPTGCLALHFNQALVFPTPDEMAEADEHEQSMMASAQRYQDEASAYWKQQETRPQTVGYLLSDSPVGLAAWIYAMFQDVSDSDGNPEAVSASTRCSTTSCSTGSRTRAPHPHRCTGRQRRRVPLPAPIGAEPDTGRLQHLSHGGRARLTAVDRGALRHRPALQRARRGGHFAAMEQPVAFADEVRTTFLTVR